MDKKLVTKDFKDITTGLRFVEDDRGNRYLVPSQDIIMSIDNNEQLENENKRLKRILEKLRSENNWLWERIHIALKERKKYSNKKAMDNLEKAVKEKES